MILAATNPDTSAFTLAYALSVLAFVGCVAAFCAISVWLIDQWATRGLHRKIAAARHAVRTDEGLDHVHGTARHGTVPKRLTKEGTR